MMRTTLGSLSMTMRFRASAIALAVSWTVLVLAFSANAQGLAALDAIAAAHSADPLPPISVQMTGVVERSGKSEPFRLLATRDEEIRIEYGSAGKDTVVSSPKLSFHDDGQKFTYPRTPSDFSQLDITGLFFVEQLRNRAIRVDPTTSRAVVGGFETQRIRVQSDRTQLHLGKNLVKDVADLYVADNGALVAISRSFYEGRPERYTQTFVFSDYRKTENIWLPYKIEMYIKSKRQQTFSVESYKFNVLADRELFISRRAR